MFVTDLDFKQILDRFYQENKYDFMLLFVSSFDINDLNIIHEIINNDQRIDCITGSNICFFYFIEDEPTAMNQKIVRWVRNTPKGVSLYGERIRITIKTTNEICQEFGILRSYLPAFILIPRDKYKEPQIFSVHNYNDFESFISPLNNLHSYIEDRDKIFSEYHQEKERIISEYNKNRARTLVTLSDVENRTKDRIFWEYKINQLVNTKTIELSNGNIIAANNIEQKIATYRKRLNDYPELVECGYDETVPYPQKELDNLHYPEERLNEIKLKQIENLNLELNSHEGEYIIEQLEKNSGYHIAVEKIFELVRTKKVRIDRLLQNIRNEIKKHGFDVFISCKSQDYPLAHELYDYLKENGFIPFIADYSIKEVGIDQYTAVIGEVINVSNNMIVFATNVDYLETSYVKAEWHAFINDINTGYKPNAKIVSILSSDIYTHNLPLWLRDKQSFTIENYKQDLINFLR